MAGECENCGFRSPDLTSFDARYFRNNRIGRTTGEIAVCRRCLACFTGRKNAGDAILSSAAQKRLIVAGPGTGKSFTFGNVLANISGDKGSLVFTLINNLVDDLERDLGSTDSIKVNTLHGFCKEVLHKHVALDGITRQFEYFPGLPILLEADAGFLAMGFSREDFHRDLANLVEDADTLRFYFHQASYYNAAGYDDSVFRVFSYFRSNPDEIPEYEIVIVDEYQDFNLLEASFIQLLAEKNDVLIAGDDDQSLYRFRHASNRYIRELFKQGDYEKFSLPYCSRCPPVLVEATNEFVIAAQRRGLLRGRIERKYECYWPDKHREHADYPRIIVADCSKLETVCEFVHQRILEITQRERLTGEEKDLQFIVIGPEAGYHIEKVREHLAARLDSDLYVLEYPEKKAKISIEEGYEIIKREVNLNLGWRIVLHCDPLSTSAEIVRKAYETGRPLVELLPQDYLERHKQQIANSPETDILLAEEAAAGRKRIRIKLTNFYGSKGLSALHTIVIGLNNYTFPKEPRALNDDEACKFIVALTRAKRSCCLVHNGEFRNGRTVNQPSIYIQLLPERVKEIKRYVLRKGRLIEM